MTTLVIPDVHERIDVLESLEPRMAQADRVVFLGDFFDKFGPDETRRTAWWLKRNLQNEKYTFLIGNHDCHYAFTHHFFKCSGYEPRKQDIIDAVLDRADWDRFQLFTRAGDYLLSHAGFADETIHLATAKDADQAFQLAREGGFHTLFSPGTVRGGWAPVGGPTWLDWNHEFAPVDGQKQIVGHTYSKTGAVRVNAGSYCIDTGLKHVAWLEDGEEPRIERVES